MKVNSIIFILLFAFPMHIFAQSNCDQISSIIEDPNSTSAWVGFTFQFQPSQVKDGQLYFMAYTNPNQHSVWRTDGTIGGTINLHQETAPFGDQWRENLITKDGVFIFDTDDTWYLVSYGEPTPIPLPELGSTSYEFIQPFNDSIYYFAGYNEDKIDAIKYNLYTKEITEIGEVMDASGWFQMQVTPTAALFQGGDYPERIYLESTKEVITIIDYLEDLNINAIKTENSNLYDKYLNLTYQNFDNNWVDVLIDLESNQLTEFYDHGSTAEHFEIGDDIYYVGRNQVSKFNKVDGTSKLLYDKKSFGSSYVIHNNKIITGENVVGQNRTSLVSIDLTSEEIKVLENSGDVHTSGGNRDFNSGNGRLYYFTNDEERRFLSYYDFDNEKEVRIQIVTEDLSRTNAHLLENINDQLVSSKVLNPGHHELILCESPSSTKAAPFSKNLKVFPNPATDELNIESKITSLDSKIYIWNTQGALILSSNFGSNQNIDITEFPTGYYYGFIKNNDTLEKFKFVKY